MSLFILVGVYTWTDSVVRTGEARDNCGVYGIPGRTRIYQKTGDKAPNLILLNFDGSLAADGVNTSSPTYYFTQPAAADATSAVMSTLTDLSIGQKLMLMDRGNPINQYFSGPDGTAVTHFGQNITITGLSPIGPTSFAILGGVYTPNATDPDLGVMTITSGGPVINYGANASIFLSSITGAGDAALLDARTYLTVAPTSGHTTTIIVGDIDPATTITTGNVTYGASEPNSFTFWPSLETNYSGTSVSPSTASTCIRRFLTSPVGVTVEGLIFDWDTQAPNLNTQTQIGWTALTRPTSRFCQFFGEGTHYNLLSGTEDFSISEFLFDEGGPFTYNISINTGSNKGRIFNGSGARGRHLVNTGANTSSSCGPSHIQVTNVHASGYYANPFADHPGVRGLVYRGCTAIAPIGSTIGGFEFRGMDEAAIDCRTSGGDVGVFMGAAINPLVQGGSFVNAKTAGVMIVRCLNPRVLGVTLRDNVDSHILIDTMCTAVSPFDVAFPGLEVDADVWGVPILGDFVLMQKGANFAEVWHDSWRFRVRAHAKDNSAPSRAPTFIVGRPTSIFSTISAGTYDTGTKLLTLTSSPTIAYRAGMTVTLAGLTGTGAFASLAGSWVTRAPTSGNTTTIYVPGLAALTVTGGTINYGTRTPSFRPFRYEFAGMTARKYEAFNVVAGLDADYELDTTLHAVPATLPASGIFPDQKVTFSKPNVGGNTATIVGTIGGATNPTLADAEVYRVKDVGRRFRILSFSYNTVTGLVVCSMYEAMPLAFGTAAAPVIAAGLPIVAAGLTGSGSVGSLNGSYVTVAGAHAKDLRFTATTGLGAIVGTGGFIYLPGWAKR